jgi:drug/metabolite transporter (DMT)-like permease
MSYHAAMAAGILLTGFAQVLLKSGVTGKGSWHHSFLNWRTAISYGMFVIVTVFNVYALQVVDLKTFGAWISVTYILVTFLSWKVLNEKIDRATVVGCSLIVLGVIIFNLPIFD